MTHITFFDRLRTWSVLLPFLLLLGATYWLDQQVQPLPPHTDENKRHAPDYIVNSLSATTLDEHGKPHYLMTAEKMVHYPDDDSTHMVKPQLISLYADRPPVYVSALRGEVSSAGDQVFLHDDVKVMRAESSTPITSWTRCRKSERVLPSSAGRPATDF